MGFFCIGVMSRPFRNNPWIHLPEKPVSGDLWRYEPLKGRTSHMLLVLSCELNLDEEFLTVLYTVRTLDDRGHIHTWDWDCHCGFTSGGNPIVDWKKIRE